MKNIFRKTEKNKSYINGKEERTIAKQNSAIMRKYERLKRRKNIPENEYITGMRNNENLVEIDNLHVYFFTDSGVIKAVNGVSFDIPKNKIVGIVGESGCGKSVTSLALMRLINSPVGQIVEGDIRYNSSSGICYNIARMPRNGMNKIRGNEIAMIFQEPMTSLNPVFTIGYQLDEVTILRKGNKFKEEAKKKSIEMLNMVGIASPERVYKSYPHELSGGMRQRVMIAMSLICTPRLIIADEPTTALDVTVQAEILELLKDLKNKLNGSIMLITHDLGVIAEMADIVVVMYAGKVIETGTVYEIFKKPCHPYTIGLQKSKPQVDKNQKKLYSIAGQVPNPINMPDYCYFKKRCLKSFSKCEGKYPPYIEISPTHKVACYLYDKKKG